MFTGFDSENIPAIQVWEFSRTFSGTPGVALTDDCAPIQFFKTGGNSSINLYLPSCPTEGKRITIYNNRFNNNSLTSIFIYSSDVSGQGTTNQIDSVGVGGVLELCYSKNIISYGPSQGSAATGWFPLNRAPYTANNAYSINNSYLSNASGPNSAVIGGFANTASGTRSGVYGGNSSTASGSNAVVVGGSGNTASGTSSAVVGGSGNSTSGLNAVIAGGENNIQSGATSFIGGGVANNASGVCSSIIGGTLNVANQSQSTVIGGRNGTTRSIIANTVVTGSLNPVAASSGVSQSALLVLGAQTTDATATVLRSNTSAAATTNQVILPNNSAYAFQGTCIANVTAGGTTSGWKFEGVIKRGANAASTALVAAVTPTVIAQDVGAVTWVLAITADTTNGGIAVTVTGQAATTIRWVCKIETTEVTF
jgi:hypothetical protein